MSCSISCEQSNSATLILTADARWTALIGIAVYTYNLGGYEEPRDFQVPCASWLKGFLTTRWTSRGYLAFLVQACFFSILLAPLHVYKHMIRSQYNSSIISMSSMQYLSPIRFDVFMNLNHFFPNFQKATIFSMGNSHLSCCLPDPKVPREVRHGSGATLGGKMSLVY